MPGMRCAVMSVAALALLSAPVMAWEVPLTVEEQWGQPGIRMVTGGVPLLPGQAMDASALRLIARDAKGKATPVPAQFRVLARWWRADKSIRWVLVDFATNLGTTQTRTFYLTSAKAGAAAMPKQPVTVEETDARIVVTTGPARFVIDRKRFAFLEAAYVDADGNGEFAEAENLIEGSPDLGTVLEDTYGEMYYASEGTKSVEVIEQGPMRVCVRARGQHRGRGGKGYRHGLYGYDYIMNFYAGSSAVTLDLVLTNNPPKSTGSPAFEDASLLVKLKGGATGYRVYGTSHMDGRLASGETLTLHQDSNGAATWQRCQGYSGSGPGGANFRGRTVSFRGFRVTKRRGDDETLVATGDHARGLALIYNREGGVILHTRDFWQQFPKAVSVGADGLLRLGLFPRESVTPHYLEDASGKGHELVFLFYNRKRNTGYATSPEGRPWPHVVADTWDYSVYPRPTLEHMAGTGALTDLGPYTVPTRGFEGYALEISARRMLMTDDFWGNGYGWQAYGSRWRAHGGHSQRGARQPIMEDNFLYRWYVTGRREWLVVGQARSRHFRDVRSYRIEGQDPFGFKSWTDFRKANRSEDHCNRPQPKDEEIKKYTQGIYGRSTWWLPNPAHMTLDLIYDRYLLFGDVRAFENLKVVAGHGGNFAAYTRPFVHRQTGWSWRALERYWELTGDEDARACLMDTLKTYEPLIGKSPMWAFGDPKKHGSVWFTQVFSRAAAMTALHTRDKRALDLCRTLAVGKERQASYFCTVFAVLYHLTGESKYKEVLLEASPAGSLRTVGTSGDFPATAHWLVLQPPEPIR